jgi:BASS family bile acid:Na+ symporter
MDINHLVMLTLQISIIITVFGFGLHATIRDVLFLERRPGLFVRSLIAMFVAVPLVAFVLAEAFDFASAVDVGLIALAISPMAPFLPSRMSKAGGSASYGIGLMALAALASVVLIPLSIYILGRYFGRELMPPTSGVIKVVLITTLLPLVAGLAIRALFPSFAERIAPAITLLGKLLLGIASVGLLVVSLPAMWQVVGNGTIIAITVFVVAGFLIGHLLGGPDPEERTVLGLSSASRHPAVALVIANTNFPDGKFGAVIILYLVLTTIVGIPYVKWCQKLTGGSALVR